MTVLSPGQNAILAAVHAWQVQGHDAYLPGTAELVQAKQPISPVPEYLIRVYVPDLQGLKGHIKTLLDLGYLKGRGASNPGGRWRLRDGRFVQVKLVIRGGRTCRHPAISLKVDGERARTLISSGGANVGHYVSLTTEGIKLLGTPKRQQQLGQIVRRRGPKARLKRKRQPRTTPTEKQMEAYLLHYGGQTYVQIGERLDISAAAVGKRVRAAKKLIAKYSRSVRAQRLPRDRRGQETVTGR